MARLWQGGGEQNSATNGVELRTAGSPAIVSPAIRSGNYSYDIPSISSGTLKGFSIDFFNGNSDGPYYARVYFKIGTLPSAANTIMAFASTIPTMRVMIKLNSDGTLTLHDDVGQIGSASSALSTGTLYRVELLIDKTPAGGSEVATARLDGTQFASASNRTIGAGVGRFYFGGNLLTEAQTQGAWGFDDVALNDSTGSFQNSWPGVGQIINLKPNAAGDSNQLGSASSTNYQQVDEETPDDVTTTISTLSDSAGETDDYNIEDSPSSIGASDTINSVAIGVRLAAGTSTPADTIVSRIMASSGGTVEEGTAIQPASTSYITNSSSSNNGILYKLVLYDLPGASTTSWTKADLDTAQIGVKKSVDSTFGALITATWLSVDSTPNAGGGGSTTVIIPQRMRMGMGA